jgi:hypothetical protein
MAARCRHRLALTAGVALAVSLTGCVTTPTTPSHRPAEEMTASMSAQPDCTASVSTGLLPEWARDQFLDGGASFRHVEGRHGAVLGVVFGYPLTSPARASRQNKILWIARHPTTGRLRIEARLDGTGPAVRRDVGFGGGQSIIDLPRPGCWRLTLRWGKHLTDVVDLPYVQAHPEATTTSRASEAGSRGEIDDRPRRRGRPQ